MLAHRYKVWSWGNQRNVGQVDTIKFDAGVTVVAKRHAELPYEVYNELLGMELGRLMGLPIPIGFVVEKDGFPYYCSANVSVGMADFPEADLEHLAINNPRLFCGITVFDGWICNGDRHAENVFYDVDTGDVYLIDHGQAFMSTSGPSHVRHRMAELPIRHDFALEVRSFDDFCRWYERLCRIPDGMIRDACLAAAQVGVSVDEAAELANLLIERRNRIQDLFRGNTGLFPNVVERRPLFSPFDCDGEPE